MKIWRDKWNDPRWQIVDLSIYNLSVRAYTKQYIICCYTPRVIFIFILTVTVLSLYTSPYSIIMNFPPNKKGQQSDRWCCVNGKPLKKIMCFIITFMFLWWKKGMLNINSIYSSDIVCEKIVWQGRRCINVIQLSFRIRCKFFLSFWTEKEFWVIRRSIVIYPNASIFKKVLFVISMILWRTTLRIFGCFWLQFSM